MSKITGFTCGAWDLLHPGHLHFLACCKSKCDILVVGLHTNPQTDRPTKNVPIQSTYERFIQLSGCQYVDDIIPYDVEDDLINMMAMLKIDIRFLGSDYIGQPYTGEHTCSNRFIKIEYIDRFHSYSSSELRRRLVK